MVVFMINALAMAFIAAIWSKSGFPNILIAMFFCVMTVINAIYAAPGFLKLVGAS